MPLLVPAYTFTRLRLYRASHDICGSQRLRSVNSTFCINIATAGDVASGRQRSLYPYIHSPSPGVHLLNLDLITPSLACTPTMTTVSTLRGTAHRTLDDPWRTSPTSPAVSVDAVGNRDEAAVDSRLRCRPINGEDAKARCDRSPNAEVDQKPPRPSDRLQRSSLLRLARSVCHSFLHDHCCPHPPRTPATLYDAFTHLPKGNI